MASKKWKRYEKEKGKLGKKPLAPGQYEKAVKEIARKGKV